MLGAEEALSCLPDPRLQTRLPVATLTPLNPKMIRRFPNCKPATWTAWEEEQHQLAALSDEEALRVLRFLEDQDLPGSQFDLVAAIYAVGLSPLRQERDEIRLARLERLEAVALDLVQQVGIGLIYPGEDLE